VAATSWFCYFDTTKLSQSCKEKQKDPKKEIDGAKDAKK